MPQLGVGGRAYGAPNLVIGGGVPPPGSAAYGAFNAAHCVLKTFVKRVNISKLNGCEIANAMQYHSEMNRSNDFASHVTRQKADIDQHV